MNQQQVIDWLHLSHRKTRPASAAFWPKQVAQGNWTTWANAFFVLATNDLCGGSNLQIRTTPRCATNRSVTGLLTPKSATFVSRQNIVDYMVQNEGASDSVQLTAESECSTQQPVDDSCSKNTYGWDFYKLLVVPSPRRLFFCCVGGGGADELDDGEKLSAGTRRKVLLLALQKIFEANSAAFVRPSDEISGVVIGASKSDRRDSYYFSADRGVFRFTELDASKCV